ncbi:MAG: efflux RND transporter periplasmic adaptor subunit [Syntrophobacteraceae bacterium]
MGKVFRVFIVLIVLASAVLAYLYLHRETGEKGLFLSGNMEVTELRLGFKIAGRVAALDVDEGWMVRQGQRLAALDGAELEHLVRQGGAALDEARERLEQNLAGFRSQEIEQASAGLRQVEAELVRLKKDFERADALRKTGAGTVARYDTALSAYQSGLARRKEAAERLSLLREGTRKEEIKSAEYRVVQAQAALGAAEERLGDTVLLAPISGLILRKDVELGETVAPGTPLFILGDLENPWIKVYVKEDKLGLVKIGQKAQVTADTYPGKIYEGVVSFISSEAEFTPRNIQTQEERVKLVFAVKVKVRNISQDLKPGMPADVRILIDG